MLFDVFAFLAHPEQFRAQWRDGELTIERLPSAPSETERSTTPMERPPGWAEERRVPADGIRPHATAP